MDIKTGLYILSGLLLGSGAFAENITSISQLDSLSLFHYSVISDLGSAATTDPFTDPEVVKGTTWVKNSAFVLGGGDEIKKTGTTFESFLKNDAYFKNNFYPCIGGGENRAYGGDTKWGVGARLFESITGWWSRSNVKNATPYEPLDSRGHTPSYYAKFANVNNSGITVHVLQIHAPDDISPPIRSDTKAFLMAKLQEILVLKQNEPGKHIVHIHGHRGAIIKEFGASSFSQAEVDLLAEAADIVTNSDQHKGRRYWTGEAFFDDAVSWYGGIYKTPLTDSTAIVWFDTGIVSDNCYLECHVFANPTRVVFQHMKLANSSRQLVTGSTWTYSAGQDRRPVVKQVDGPVTYVNWSNFPVGSVPPVTNGAAFVSQVVPSALAAGQTTNVTVRMKNTGTAIWSSADAQKLGSQNPQDTNTWGRQRVDLPAGVTVAPGQEYSFVFSITAPTIAGTYNFQWKMVDDAGSNVGWFGPLTSNKQITVTSGNQAPYFIANPFSLADATTGVAYNQSFSAKAVDPEGGTKTFSKVSGPAWMSVSSAGNATGTPGSVDVGTNSFMVQVADNGGLSATATMKIKVIATTTTVPWVTNLTEAAAGTAITNAGLVVSSINHEYHATIAAGRIFSQTPGGNTTVNRGSSVALACSLGPQVSTNLVVNGSFETNTNGWKLTGSAYRTTSMAAGGGVASLRITNSNSSATQYVAIVSGKTYDISVNVNVAARSAGMVIFDTGDKYDGAGQGQFTFSAATAGWTNRVGSFTATNNFLTVRMFSDSAFAGTAYFDLIELKAR